MSELTKRAEEMATHYSISPMSIFDVGLDMLEGVYKGTLDISNATSPAVKSWELAATVGAAGMIHGEHLTRRQYASLAQTTEDLFYHMSDEDHAGRFGSPLRNVEIMVAISTEDIRREAVEDLTSGMNKVTIPRDSVYRVAGNSFYAHYPIDLLVDTDGTISARYDITVTSPLKTIRETAIETRVMRSHTGVEFIHLKIQADQLDIISESVPVTDASGGKLAINFADTFYHARAYQTANGTNWTELVTTHVRDQYDPNTPTVIFEVIDGLLKVTMPDVYITNGLANGTLRIDILTTKGPLTIDMSEYQTGDWTYAWNDYNSEAGVYLEALARVDTGFLYSIDRYTGGTSPMTFAELKNQVVYNLGSKAAPLTLEELRARLDKDGYRLAVQKNTVMSRVFTMSKELSKPGKEDLSSSVGVASYPFVIDRERGDYSEHFTHIDGLTVIKPSMLYYENLGGITAMSNDEVRMFKLQSSRAMADTLNENNIMYSPFYYVLDENLAVFEARPYYLSAPKSHGVSHVNNNPDLGYTVMTTDVKINWSSDNQRYEMVVTAAIPANGQDYHAVLNYTDPDSGEQWDLVGIPSPVSSTSMEFRFGLGSRLDIDHENNFTLTGLLGNSATSIPRVNLEDTTFDLVYVTPGAGNGLFSAVLAENHLNTDVIRISHERLALQFGRHAAGFYTNTRVLIDKPTYKLHQEDVYDVHEVDVVERDEFGPALVDDGNGNKTFVYLARAGDRKRDPVSGEDIIIHAKGTEVRNIVTGQPEIDEEARISYEVRLTLMDAAVAFGETDEIIAYRGNIPTEIMQILDTDVKDIDPSLIENTEVFYEPAATASVSRVRIEGGREIVISTALGFVVDAVLTQTAYSNTALRESIRSAIKDTIVSRLEDRRYSNSDLIADLTKLSPNEVKSISVVSPIQTSQIGELIDDNAVWSVGRKVIALTTGVIDVVDDIEVRFNI